MRVVGFRQDWPAPLSGQLLLHPHRRQRQSFPSHHPHHLPAALIHHHVRCSGIDHQTPYIYFNRPSR
jgi:hypothetical protein